MKVKILWGYYEFDTVAKTVTRMKPGHGTRIGKILTPYFPSSEPTVGPCVGDRRFQMKISDLEKKYCGRLSNTKKHF